MQTFLPYQDFQKSASVLDNRRLGKQRVEVLQILKALTIPEYGWKNHPATKMWRGHEAALVQYGLAVCQEWKSRGFKDTCYEKISEFKTELPAELPKWVGDERVHSSHRSNLIRKLPEHYSLFGWAEDDSIPYHWPV